MSEHDISDRSVKPNVIVRHDRQSTASSYVSDLEQDEPESASPISSTSPHGIANNSRQSDGRRRTNHLRRLLSERKARVQYFNKVLRRKDDGIDSQQNLTEVGSVVSESFATGEKPRHVRGASDASASVVVQLTKQQKEDVKKTSEALKTVQKKMEEYDAYVGVDFPIEIRMENLTYSVPVTLGGNKIRTVYNSSAIYRIVKFFKGLRQGYANEEQKGTKVILDDMSIVLRPGKMYLVLGPPGSGKSTFLRAIAGRLKVGKDATMAGSISYNGKRREEKTKFHIDNAIAFIDQLDRHAPRLSVDETFEFAYQCKRGGTHINFKHVTDTEDARQQKKRADEERLLVNTNLESLGISHVRDTFVGDDEIRGVSGGQRRRVTVGEMLMDSSPILCGDEISNGLDASSTFDMIQILMHVGRMQKMMRVISLLQPSPETVSLFDEVILLAQGNLLYVGPIYEVEDYFANLGYKAPSHMDIADFLQLLSTSDAENFFDPPAEIAQTQSTPYTASELAEIFRQSDIGKNITRDLKLPHKHVWGSGRDVEQHEEASHLDDTRFRRKYANSFPRSISLNLRRNLIIWVRDRRVLIANAVKNVIMGISVGGVFFQTDDVVSILGVLFQGMLFIMLGKNSFCKLAMRTTELPLNLVIGYRCDDECSWFC
jgi:ABC-type multidrug transport system ATPase subunit